MMLATTGQIIRLIVGILLAVGMVGFVVVRSIQKAEDPARMALKWVLTALLLLFMWKVVAPIVGVGGYAAIGGILYTVACGWVLAFIWRHQIGALIAQPFASLYDGGDIPPEPKPFYSVARSRQKQGHYEEAVLEVQKQLERFPTDFEGHMLLAEIQAENLHDLIAAEETIQRLCAQEGHAPKNIAFALYSLADWHLAVGRDLDGARRALEQILVTLPETEFSLGAAQRIAHLGSPEMLLDPALRRRFIVSEGMKNIGLTAAPPPVRQPELEPGLQAAEYVKHLDEYPHDTEAREKLAIIYADHYGRLDLATAELEQMITEPHQPSRLVVHWLNVLADLQIRGGADYETVRQTLQRIIDRDPKVAAAEIARSRLAHLKLEIKGQQTKGAVKMGTYEQNIGLKRGR